MLKRSRFSKSAAKDSGWESTHGANANRTVFPETVIEAGNLPRVMITDAMDDKAVTWLGDRCMVHFDPTVGMDRDAYLRMVEVADVLVGSDFSLLDDAALAAAKRLSLVVDLGSGVDDELAAALQKRTIRVMRADKSRDAAIAEYVLTSALMLLRRAFQATPLIAAGQWPHQALAVGGELRGKTVGLVGNTSAAQATSRLVRALGAKVVYLTAGKPEISVEENLRQVGAAELLALADVISIHEPVADLRFDSSSFAQMKRGALLINTTDANLVDEAALAQALRSAQLGGAALDVLSSMPLAQGNAFEACPNLLLTPSIAGLSNEASIRAGTELVERIAAELGLW
jgi:(S)-sulfolactate dehydrogenase